MVPADHRRCKRPVHSEIFFVGAFHADHVSKIYTFLLEAYAVASMSRTPGTKAHLPFSQEEARALRKALRAWFRRNARKLPWREDAKDPSVGPYRVWVSEVMLQQTQVATVIPYYLRFVARFPDLAALAAASQEEVLSLWSGLGYYRRAKLLHAAAQELSRSVPVALPSDPLALQALPGIGRYTAGAIASIAFGRPEPIVDGNVMRVLTRLRATQGDPTKPPLESFLWAQATALVRGCKQAGEINEALMELGALVCNPRAPVCTACPLEALCEGARLGAPERFPELPARPSRPQLHRSCVILRDPAGAILLAQRKQGLLGGLFEPPQIAMAHTKRFAPRGRVRHIFTHRELLLDVYEGSLRKRKDAPPCLADTYDGIFWALDPEQRPLSSLARKVLALRDPESKSPLDPEQSQSDL